MFRSYPNSKWKRFISTNQVLEPLCLIPNQDLSSSKPTFIPRNKTAPKALDWVLLPSIFSDFNISTSLLPQTFPPTSDHLLTVVKIRRDKLSDKDKNFFIGRKPYIASNLFRDPEILAGLKLASKRIAKINGNDSVQVVQQYQQHSTYFLNDLTRVQAERNKSIISKAMTMLAKEHNNSQRPRLDARKHYDFWEQHFNSPPVGNDLQLNCFLDTISNNKLSNLHSDLLSAPITADEVKLAAHNSPNNSSPGIDVFHSHISIVTLLFTPTWPLSLTHTIPIQTAFQNTWRRQLYPYSIRKAT